MDLREQLMRVREGNGGVLTPDAVVEEARAEDSPLHALIFDRDVPDAAEEYYRARARAVIRTCRLAYKEADETSPAKSVRAFHAVRSEAEDRRRYVYEPAEEIAVDPLKRAMLMREMERDWMELKRRYLDFAEFVEMVRTDSDVGAA